MSLVSFTVWLVSRATLHHAHSHNHQHRHRLSFSPFLFLPTDFAFSYIRTVWPKKALTGAMKLFYDEFSGTIDPRKQAQKNGYTHVHHTHAHMHPAQNTHNTQHMYTTQHTQHTQHIHTTHHTPHTLSLSPASPPSSPSPSPLCRCTEESAEGPRALQAQRVSVARCYRHCPPPPRGRQGLSLPRCHRNLLHAKSGHRREVSGPCSRCAGSGGVCGVSDSVGAGACCVRPRRG